MTRIVVVGGGIAGIVTATHLARRGAGRSNFDILLVDRNFAHVWKPSLHTFAAGTANDATQSIAFTSHAKRNGFRYWPGEIVGLDRTRKEIELGPMDLPDGRSRLSARTVTYDILILALGSRCDDFNTPGVADHCFFIDDVGQAQATNRALRSMVLQAVDHKSESRVVIVGGGATGVELAAELTHGMGLLSHYSPDGTSLPPLHITLIESRPRLLAPFPERISSAAEAKLKELGVDVRTKTRVVSVDRRSVSLDNGQRIEAPICVWAAGVRAPAVSAKLDGLQINEKGQVIVRDTMQSANDDHIFALGDCASVATQDGKPLPTTAQVARQQALALSRSLFNAKTRNKPLETFTFSDRGSLVTLGAYTAYGSLGQQGFFRAAVFEGRLAQIGHAALYRMHQLDLYGIVRGGAGWLADSLLRIVRPRISLD